MAAVARRARHALREAGLLTRPTVPSYAEMASMIRQLRPDLFGTRHEVLEAFVTGHVFLTPMPSKKAKAAARKAKSWGFYDSDAWKQVRYRVLQKHGARCLVCGATRRDGVRLHVDHIKPRSLHPELELEESNLQVLCEPCNIGKLNRDETDWR